MNKRDALAFLRELGRYASQREMARVTNSAQSGISARWSRACNVLGDHEANAQLAKIRSANGKSAVSRDESAAGAKPDAGVELAEKLAAGDSSAVELAQGKNEVARLRKAMKALSERVLTDDMVRKHIFAIAHTKPGVPDWLNKPVKQATPHSAPGVPVIFASDWHWGEVVRPSEIGGVNEYNLDIARERCALLVDRSIDLLTNHMVNPNYPGIVFALGGDMVSGNIHDELSETNDMPIMPVVLDLVDHLHAAILRLKSVFGRVFVPCVSGNHGRLHNKVRAKEFNFNSYDWLIYQQLDRLFAADPDVVFFIPDGPDALVAICGHRYLFTHGNQFRGGDGMIGAVGPIIRGDHKKRSRNAQVNQDYDTLVIGHFHQLIQMKRVIVNGSLIGYNEYAYSNNFGYEPPQQALWITHPVQGITFSMPVNLATDVRKQGAAEGGDSSAWVAFHAAKPDSAKKG